MNLLRRQKVRKREISWVTVALLLVLFNQVQSRSTTKKSARQLFFNKFCDEGGSCKTDLEFYPPFSSNKTIGDCYWNRVEIDLPRFSRWTLDESSVQINAPGNMSCDASSVSLSSRNVFELDAPTLDCYRNFGCSCTDLTPKASRAIRWKPVKKLLKKPFSRTACRMARTYLYVRLNCFLDPNTLIPDNAAPVTVSISWRLEGNKTASSMSTNNQIRSFCRAKMSRSFASYNRWFLTLLVSISAIGVLAVILWMLVRAVLRAVAARREAKGGGKSRMERGLAEVVQVMRMRQEKAAGFMGEVLEVHHHNGRSRWFTATLVAAVGLYIAGILFEARIKAQTPYERAFSPSLRSAILDLTGYLQINSYFSFIRDLARLLLTIMICSAWGGVVFFALLFNLSAQPKLSVGYRREAFIFRCKLVVSIIALLVLDLGFSLYVLGNWSMSSRWLHPAAHHFLLLMTLILFLVTHVLFAKLVFRPDEPFATLKPAKKQANKDQRSPWQTPNGKGHTPEGIRTPLSDVPLSAPVDTASHTTPASPQRPPPSPAPPLASTIHADIHHAATALYVDPALPTSYNPSTPVHPVTPKHIITPPTAPHLTPPPAAATLHNLSPSHVASNYAESDASSDFDCFLPPPPSFHPSMSPIPSISTPSTVITTHSPSITTLSPSTPPSLADSKPLPSFSPAPTPTTPTTAPPPMTTVPLGASVIPKFPDTPFTPVAAAVHFPDTHKHQDQNPPPSNLYQNNLYGNTPDTLASPPLAATGRGSPTPAAGVADSLSKQVPWLRNWSDRESKAQLREKLRSTLDWARQRLTEEDETFRYSPWFLAPMIIAVVLLLFFFIKEMYLIESVRVCLGTYTCPEWNGFNQAVVPIITSIYHAVISGRPPSSALSLLNLKLVDTPAQTLLTGMRSNFDIMELVNRTVISNFANIEVPSSVVTMDFDVLSYQNDTPPFQFFVLQYSRNREILEVPLTTRPVIIANKYEVMIRSKQVIVNNMTWNDFYYTTRTFQENSEQLGSCDKNVIGEYIAEVADQSYREYPDREQLDTLANQLGVTGTDLAQQLILSTARPALVDLCNTTDVMPTTYTVNNNVQTILEGIIESTFSDVEANVLAGMNNTVGAGTRRSLAAQKQKLDKGTRRERQFFRDLQKAVGGGFYMGGLVALFVSLVSMGVIMAVYKKAVLKLRKTLALTVMLTNQGENGGIMQGMSPAQQFMMGAMAASPPDAPRPMGTMASGMIAGLGGDSQEDAVQMFAMLERIRETKMATVIFFYGMVFSTVLLQLVVCTILFGFVFTLFFHPAFWKHAFPYIASFLLAFGLSQLVALGVIRGLIANKIAPNDKITKMSTWLAYYIVFSFAYIILGILLAAIRLLFIVLSALILSCRIDICLNLLSRVLDPAYNSFLAMMKMQVEMKYYSEPEMAMFEWNTGRVMLPPPAGLAGPAAEAALPSASSPPQLSHSHSRRDEMV